jgi:glutathione S-transferase
MCESEAIVDYLEAAYPLPALRPADPWARAKVSEITTFVELHLELVARELYPQAFFGGSVSEEVRSRVRERLDRNAAAFKRLAVFGPYVSGDSFTTADCAAYVSLPLVAMACKAVYGTDLLAEAGVEWKPYVKLIADRPSVQRVDADRKAALEARAAAAASNRA